MRRGLAEASFCADDLAQTGYRAADYFAREKTGSVSLGGLDGIGIGGMGGVGQVGWLARIGKGTAFGAYAGSGSKMEAP